VRWGVSTTHPFPDRRIKPLILHGRSKSHTILGTPNPGQKTSDLGFWDARSPSWPYLPISSPAIKRFLAVLFGRVGRQLF
jgi:hypothetical protein